MLPRDGCRHDELESLAGRLTHCANYGSGCGGAQPDNQLNRQRCAALASHLHLAAITDKMALKAMMFEHLLPTWLIDQNRRVHIANSAAVALSVPGQRISIVHGCLTLPDARGAQLLRSALQGNRATETEVSWTDSQGDATLVLRPLAKIAGSQTTLFAATLAPAPRSEAQTASLLATKFGLHTRQSELAAHLVAGRSLSASARMMQISRNTAQEHLVSLMHRTNTPDRGSLIALFRRALQH